MTVKEAVAAASKETGFVDPDASPVVEAAPAAVAPATEPVKETTTVVPATDEGKVSDAPKVGEEKLASPAPKTDKETETPASGDEVDLRVTPEELDAINKDPNLKKVYRSMVRGFTEKTSDFAGKRKELEAAMDAVTAIRADPKKAAMALAAATGGKITYDDGTAPAVPANAAPVVTEKAAVVKATELLTEKLGKEAADALGPVLIEAVKILAGEELSPIKQAMAIQDENAGKIALKSAVGEFGASIAASGLEWDETVEQEMAELVGQVIPGKDMPLPKFLKVLHNTVMANRAEKSTTGRVLVRLRTAAETKEPVQPARTAPTAPVGAITAGMDNKTATALAIESARRELGVR
jgi:hypothetical protein